MKFLIYTNNTFLCRVNTRKQAAKLFLILSEMGDSVRIERAYLVKE